MRSFNYGALAVDEVVGKLVGNSVHITVTYTGATSLILFIANGTTLTASEHAEITDADGNLVTRFTASGAGSEKFTINGLTPGTYISLQEVSGTGTAQMWFVTGSER